MQAVPSPRRPESPLKIMNRRRSHHRISAQNLRLFVFTTAFVLLLAAWFASGALASPSLSLRRVATVGPFCAVISWDPPSFADFQSLEVHAGSDPDFTLDDSTLSFRTSASTDTMAVVGGLVPDT